MKKVFGRILAWLAALGAGVAFIITVSLVKDFGKLETEPELGVVYSNETAEVAGAPVSDITVLRDVSYGEGEGCQMDVAYLQDGKKKPLMLLVHGDAYQSGSRSDLYQLLNTYSNKGFVVATVDYGLLPSTVIAEQQKNILSAADFLAVHADDYEIDSRRVVFVGESSGAQLAARIVEEVARDPDKYLFQPVGLAVVSGITSFDAFSKSGTVSDFTTILDNPAWISISGETSIDDMDNNGEDGQSMQSAVDNELRARTVNAAEEIAGIDVTYNVVSELPPVVIFHGADDEAVPLSVARSFYDALQKARVTSSMVIVPGMTHETDYSRLLPYLDRFLARYVR